MIIIIIDDFAGAVVDKLAKHKTPRDTTTLSNNCYHTGRPTISRVSTWLLAPPR